MLNYSCSDTINDIKISGNKRISKETILVLGDINLGSEFDDISLNRSLKKLYDKFLKILNYHLKVILWL